MAWITIASYSSPEEAYIVKGMLESHDIPVALTNATISSVYPMTDTWAPVGLQVPGAMADEAIRLLKLHGDRPSK